MASALRGSCNSRFSLVLFGILLTACTSQPERIRSASIGDAGQIAQSENPDDRDISHLSEPSFDWFTDTEATLVLNSDGYSSERSLDGHTGWNEPEFASGRFWIARYFPEVGRQSTYHSRHGYEIGAAGFDDEMEITLSGYYLDAQFDDERGNTLEDPGVIGWHLTAGKRWPLTEHLSFQAGGGFGSGWLLWEYANPLIDGNARIEGDSLAFVSISTPLSLQSHAGPIMTEFVALPTLRFSEDYSEEGFSNDITHFYRGIPLVIRVSVVF